MSDNEIELDPRAERDVAGAVDWYDEHGSGLGDQFLEDLDDLLDNISQHPRMHRRLDNDVRRGLMNRFPYAVYYQIRETTMRVVAVLHTSRRPDYWKDR